MSFLKGKFSHAETRIQANTKRCINRIIRLNIKKESICTLLFTTLSEKKLVSLNQQLCMGHHCSSKAQMFAHADKFNRFQKATKLSASVELRTKAKSACIRGSPRTLDVPGSHQRHHLSRAQPVRDTHRPAVRVR